jgi:SsrA-binding protein
MDNRKAKEFLNRKANFDYKIEDTFEAGIVLLGSEIKAIRNGRININTSYAKIIGGELFWIGGNFDVEGDKQRTKKLLIKKNEINKLIGKTSEQNYSIIPIKLYLKRGRAKLLLGLGKGMKKYEKRDKIKDREQERDVKRIVGV